MMASGMTNQRSHNKRRLDIRARHAMAWVTLMFVAIQLSIAFLVGPEWDQARDPEYDAKLIKLRERLAEFPQQPLILVLGSSRSLNGIIPEVCLPTSSSDQSPIVFNFALPGFGPRQQLVVLRRLLEEGIRPAGVLSEVLPATLSQDGRFSERTALKRRHMLAEDLAIRKRFPINDRYPVQRQYSDWFSAWYGSRLRILRRFAPLWIESEQFPRDFARSLGPWGWLSCGNGAKNPTGAQYQRGLFHARKTYEAWLAQWKLSPVADRAVRDLLTTCQHEQIRVALYLTPEGSPFRAWYPPKVREELESYLTGVCRKHKVNLLDATLWSPDSDFWDGHHLTDQGATRFSQRFRHELLDSFVANLGDTNVLTRSSKHFDREVLETSHIQTLPPRNREPTTDK